jgi:hypothetical protein
MAPRKSTLALTFLAATIAGASLPLLAADDAFGRDLKVTIALQGHPCDQIVSSTRNGDSDYLAACKDGNRYHVYVNPQGRVIVDKQ